MAHCCCLLFWPLFGLIVLGRLSSTSFFSDPLKNWFNLLTQDLVGVGISFFLLMIFHFVLVRFAWLGFFLGFCSANFMVCVFSQRTG